MKAQWNLGISDAQEILRALAKADNLKKDFHERWLQCLWDGGLFGDDRKRGRFHLMDCAQGLMSGYDTDDERRELLERLATPTHQ